MRDGVRGADPPRGVRARPAAPPPPPTTRGPPGSRRVLAFDMGGTTAKICLIDDGEPQITREFEVARVWRFKRGSGLPLLVPVVELIEIGAGGGSIARVDRMGLPKVGPGERGVRARAGVLRARRRAAHRHRRQPRCSATSTRATSSAARCRSTAPRPRRPSSATWREPLGLSSPRRPGASTPSSPRTWPTPRSCTRWSAARRRGLRALRLRRRGADARGHARRAPRHRAGGRAAGRGRALVLRVSRLAAGVRGRAVARSPAGGGRPRRDRRAARRARGRGARAAGAGRRGRRRRAVRRFVEMRYRGQGYEIEVPAPPGRPDAAWLAALSPRSRRSIARGIATCRAGCRWRRSPGGSARSRRAPSLPPPRPPAGLRPSPKGERPIWIPVGAAASRPCRSGTATPSARASARRGPRSSRRSSRPLVVTPAFEAAVDDGLNVVLTRRTP